jgi:hypothetical protein
LPVYEPKIKIIFEGVNEPSPILKFTKVHPYAGPPSSLNMLKFTLRRKKSRSKKIRGKMIF